MAFYINPPGGNISLQNLSHYAETRFKFLSKVLETKDDRMKLYNVVREIETVKDSECLIEGSSKDKVSHFILRLLMCGDKEMQDFITTSETVLFDFRFSCMTREELCKLFKSIDPYLTSLKRNNYHNSNFRNTIQTFGQIKNPHSKWRTVVNKYLSGASTDCFHVQFQTVLQFVRMRQVVLQRGIASVPFCRLREVVTSLFNELLQEGLSETQSKFHSKDERILNLRQKIKHLYRSGYGYKRGLSQSGCIPSLLHSDIDTAASYFPPCMSHVHRQLRHNHRLKHHTRIQYTLFLKEIGVPVHEALMFWRKEYSMFPSNNTSCNHDWQHHEGRYTYSIRHLYGLEGSRVNYRGHTCRALQNNFYGPLEEGGCPFSHHDNEHLMALMSHDGVYSNQNTILHLAAGKQYSTACRTFYNEKVKVHQIETGMGPAPCTSCNSKMDPSLANQSRVFLHPTQHSNKTGPQNGCSESTTKPTKSCDSIDFNFSEDVFKCDSNVLNCKSRTLKTDGKEIYHNMESNDSNSITQKIKSTKHKTEPNVSTKKKFDKKSVCHNVDGSKCNVNYFDSLRKDISSECLCEEQKVDEHNAKISSNEINFQKSEISAHSERTAFTSHFIDACKKDKSLNKISYTFEDCEKPIKTDAEQKRASNYGLASNCSPTKKLTFEKPKFELKGTTEIQHDNVNASLDLCSLKSKDQGQDCCEVQDLKESFERPVDFYNSYRKLMKDLKLN